MSSILDKLRADGKIRPPTWIAGNIMYETIMGSTAYDVSLKDSDWDMTLLLHCLEEHYGTLEGCIVTDNQPIVALREIADVLEKHRGLFS